MDMTAWIAVTALASNIVLLVARTVEFQSARNKKKKPKTTPVESTAIPIAPASNRSNLGFFGRQVRRFNLGAFFLMPIFNVLFAIYVAAHLAYGDTHFPITRGDLGLAFCAIFNLLLWVLSCLPNRNPFSN
jgi:hypothetical protein